MLSRTQETPISPPPRPNNESHESRLRACLIVLGGICNFFATFGFVNTWGVFQAYYEAHFKLGSAEVAWIGSIQYASLFLPGLIAGRLVDQAIYRVPLFVASVTLISMTFLIGSCTMYWQLLLAQGICSGICCGIIFGPTTAVVAQWFHTHRALALGLVACGSSLGGIVVPTLFEFLLLRIGFTWAMRSLALLQLLALGISNLTLRLKLSAVPSPQKIETVDAFSLKTPVFLIYCASALCTFLGSTTMIGYLTVDALAAGVSKNTVTFLLAVMNASSAIGRISSGLVADRFGALKVLIPFTGTAAVITYLWPFAHGFGPLAAIAICYGFSSGAYVTLCAIPVMSMNPVHTGQSIGMLQMCMAIGALVGTPISGIIHDRTKSFQPVGLYAGSMLALAAGMMLITQLVLSHQRPIHKS